MNFWDWYYQQRVSQSEMDQAFEWVQDADLAIVRDLLSDPGSAGGPYYGGIIAGGATTEQATPDLTVAVSAIAAWGKQGERINDATPTNNVDCSQDEYGTDSVVLTPGESRIISIFARQKTLLQDPKVDGNGLTVYTKKVESMEYFVRMGDADVSPTAPALLSDALLLVDIERAEGQTTIQDSDMDFSRREDWCRFTGSNLDDFVHGSPKEAIRDLYEIMDTIWGGAGPFTFAQEWYNFVAVGVVSGAPSTITEALEAIVEDLATVTGGSQLVGTPAITGTTGGYGDFSATNVATMLANISDLAADHINGGALQHTDEAIGTTADLDWKMIRVDDSFAFSVGDPIINEDDGTAEVAYINDSDDGETHILIIKNVTGTWSGDAGLQVGTPYVYPDTYYRGNVLSLPDILSGDELNQILLQITEQINSRPELGDDHHITGDRWSHGFDHHHNFKYIHSLSAGGGPPESPLNELENGYNLGGIDGRWGHAYDTPVTTTMNNIVDICRGWDYKRSQPCVYVVGNVDGGEIKISKLFMDKGDQDFIDEDVAVCMGDDVDTLTTTNPNADAFAVCSNGERIFLLCENAVSGASSIVVCFDARTFETGTLKHLWTWTPSSGVVGLTKTNSRIRVVGDYVYVLFGSERCDTASPGTPLGRCNVSDGLGGLEGLGKGFSGASPAYPLGGLYVSRQYDVFYTCADLSTGELITAAPDLTDPGIGQIAVGFARDCVIPGGRYLVAGAPGASYSEVSYWDFIDDVNASLNINGADPNYVDTAPVLCDFDGTTVWFKYCHDDGYTGQGDLPENYAVFGIHASEFKRRNTSTGVVYTPPRIYQINEPTHLAAPGGKRPGRICAWGPGIWNIPFEENGDKVFFLPFSRLF